jgi:hypothetical protein
MCVTQYVRTKKKTGVGYKVFNVNGKQLISEFWGGARPVRKWLKAAGGYHRYGAGWHIFTSIQSARAWADGAAHLVRKVKYRGAFLVGKQSNFRVVVAKEIYIFRGVV